MSQEYMPPSFSSSPPSPVLSPSSTFLSSSSPSLPYSRDLPKIIFSFIIFFVFFLYGNCLALLGPSLPSLSTDYHRSIPKVGSSFTFRGIGFGLGTLLSAYLLTWKSNQLSKELYVILSLMLMNFSLFLLLCNEKKNFVIFLFAFLLQGISFGGIDTIGNCLLPELWGKRSQPWMQSLHFSLGFGSIISPILVGNLGYKYTFLLLCLLGILPPLFTLVFAYFYLPNFSMIVFEGLAGFPKDDLSSSLLTCHGEYVYLNEENIENEKESTENKLAINANSNTPSFSILSSPSSSKYSIVASSMNEENSNYEMKKMNFNDNLMDNVQDEDEEITFNRSSSLNMQKDAISSTIPPHINTKIDLTEKEYLTPLNIKLLVFIFYFLYVGAETSFGGWISGYLILTKITDNEKTASYVSSIFWSTLTLGRFVAIFCSLYLGSRRMIQLELLLCFLCSFFMLFFMYNLVGSLVFSSLLGFCFSAMFPVMLSLMSEYGFKLDDATTTVFVVGASLGEAILPIIVGLSIEFYSPYSLIVIVFSCVLSISILFLLIDRVSLKLISQEHQTNILSFFNHSTKVGNNTYKEFTYSKVHSNNPNNESISL